MNRREFVALIAVVSVLALFSTLLPAVVPALCAQTEKSGAAPPTVEDGEVRQPGGKGASGSTAEPSKDSGRVREGDLVELNFTASNEKGEIVRTTDGQVFKDPNLHKASDFLVAADYVPEDVWVGHSASIPGLGEAVIGMMAGEKQRIILHPEKAYGAIDPAKRKDIPCTRSMPRKIQMSPEDYIQRFHSFPVIGKEVPIAPYFNAAITEVSERSATLECRAEDGSHFEATFGSVEIKVNGETIAITFTPKLGSPISIEGQQGRIVATDGQSFTVDFNNPLAGQNITIDVEVISTTKASELDAIQIPWIEDHDSGLALAQKEGKPAVVVLYADWCGFCKKFFGETLQDPRVKVLKDRFVWIRSNSDKNSGLKAKYGQEGFPMILVEKPDGVVVDRIDGYRDALAFRDELAKASKSL